MMEILIIIVVIAFFYGAIYSIGIVFNAETNGHLKDIAEELKKINKKVVNE